MLIRLIGALVIGGRRFEAGAELRVSDEFGAALVAQGLAVPVRPGRETTTAPIAERAIVRK